MCCNITLRFNHTENCKPWLCLAQILQHSSAQLWSSSRLVAQGNLEESEDGIHLGPLALKHDTQVSSSSAVHIINSCKSQCPKTILKYSPCSESLSF
jgi:hypothetical protein